MQHLPFNGFTFIIPHRKEETVTLTKQAITDGLKQFEGAFPYEIITAAGNHPTVQRNAGIARAQYNHLYFLDNDSLVNAKSLRILVAFLKTNPQTTVIGGPSVLPSRASLFEKTVNLLFSNGMLVGKFSARYSQRGSLRCATEKELILCNLVFNRAVFLRYGAFNEKLYPNEENEYLARLQAKGEALYYHPEIYVERHQRKTFTSFVKQVFTYGRGRAEQTRQYWRGFPPLLLLVPFFSLFFTAAVGVLLLQLASIFSPLPTTLAPVREALLLPSSAVLLGYVVFCLFFFLHASLKQKRILWFLPVLLFSCHFFYGLGMLRGFAARRYRMESAVVRFEILVERSEDG